MAKRTKLGLEVEAGLREAILHRKVKLAVQRSSRQASDHENVSDEPFAPVRHDRKVALERAMQRPGFKEAWEGESDLGDAPELNDTWFDRAEFKVGGQAVDPHSFKTRSADETSRQGTQKNRPNPSKAVAPGPDTE